MCGGKGVKRYGSFIRKLVKGEVPIVLGFLWQK
jgi:hypothetical protein